MHTPFSRRLRVQWRLVRPISIPSEFSSPSPSLASRSSSRTCSFRCFSYSFPWAGKIVARPLCVLCAGVVLPPLSPSLPRKRGVFSGVNRLGDANSHVFCPALHPLMWFCFVYLCCVVVVGGVCGGARVLESARSCLGVRCSRAGEEEGGLTRCSARTSVLSRWMGEGSEKGSREWSARTGTGQGLLARSFTKGGEAHWRRLVPRSVDAHAGKQTHAPSQDSFFVALCSGTRRACTA